MIQTSNRNFWLIVLIILAVPSLADAATVHTRYGIIEGRVIVRESIDRLIVTVVKTEEKRLFQFYAQDIESVTAVAKILIGEKTLLKKEPVDESDTAIELCRGMEIEIIKGETNQEWVQVKGWSNTEGWIRKKVLTDTVVFSPPETRPPAGVPSKVSTPSEKDVKSTSPPDRPDTTDTKS